MFNLQICNKIFTPTAEQLDKAKRIVAAFEDARKKDPNVGVITFEGSQIEELHVNHAKRIIEAELLVSKVTELDQSEVIQTSSSKYKIGNFFENFKLGRGKS